MLSILHHTAGSHIFPSFDLFPRCAHGPVEENKPWIPAGMLFGLNQFEKYQLLGSLAMEKLRKAICGKNDKNLSDLEYMTGILVFLDFM